MKKLLLLITLFFCIYATKATTIVIYITPDFVIMAADSKGIYTNARTYKESSIQVPKIFKSGDLYFGLSGIVANAAQHLDVAAIINQQLRNNENISVAIEQIKKELKRALLVYLRNNKKNNPALFKKEITLGTYITSIGIIGIRHQKPYAHLLGFKVTNPQKLEMHIEEDGYPIDTVQEKVFYLGKSSAIHTYMDTVKHVDIDPAQFTEKLVMIQVEKTPESVGLPIDIIKITPKETQWIRRKASTPIEMK